ncbi:hypothetical protein P8452_66659 [Trifolium repens]|nr:hypothetical protein P8452_66659 [Trifolium repens]
MKMSLFMHGDELLAMKTSEIGDELVIYNVKNSNSVRFLLGQKIHGEINMLKVYNENLVCPFGISNVKMPKSSSKGGENGKHGKKCKGLGRRRSFYSREVDNSGL